MRGFIARRTDKANWSVVYSTLDAWEAELVRSALLSENIDATVKPAEKIRDAQGKKRRQNVVLVPGGKLAEARMVIRRTSMVISSKEDIIAEQEKLASQVIVEEREARQQPTPSATPAGEPVLLAEKDGVGKIFYYAENDTYELRLEMEFYKASHFMTGEEWDEFTNFSAQRQEFFILLKEKYPRLAILLKENKMRPDFLKLIEYSYGKSQPPKRR